MSAEFTARLQAALGSAYRLDEELGGGGMSRVYRARETALGRDVVLKVLPPELTSSVNLERFRREIQYAAQLQHPHIVPLLNAGESDDLLWYTMPLITGESLRAVLDRRGGLPSAEVLQILHDVAGALGSAHALGLVHRDIKPENILIQGDHALVTDFGVAKAISAALPGSGATAVGVAVGTPAYMAPEQVAGDPAADHRIDIYALGLLAYELLTGAAPFREASPHQTMAAQLVRQPTPPDAMLANLPPGLSILVMRCLQKDPAHRYQDATELTQDLRRISDGEGGRVARGLASPVQTTRASAPRRAGTLAMVTGVAAAALAFGYYLAIGREPAPTAEPALEPSAATATPASLTAADSVAIAAAVERALLQQSAEAETSTRAMLDSIRREITATVTDSIRRASRGTSQGRTGPSVDLSRGLELRRQMDALLSYAGSSADRTDGRDAPAAPRLGSEPASRVMIVPTSTAPGSGWFSVNQRTLVDQVGVALGSGFPVEVVASTGRTDSLLARGVPPEAVARLANSRFYMTLAPSRQRDSLGVTVLIHDLSPGSRQVRTVHVPVTSRALTSGAVAESLAARIAGTVAEMQGATPPRASSRSRPPLPRRPDSIPP